MINRKKVATIIILSHWQKCFSIFKGTTYVKAPQYNSDVDSVLESIRVGNHHNLKVRIAELMAASSKDISKSSKEVSR